MNPFINLEVTAEHIIREFNDDINIVELMWHRDNEDRLVEALHDTDWQVQIDNELPISLNKPIETYGYVTQLYYNYYIYSRVISKYNYKGPSCAITENYFINRIV
jgi:hypothetical protein